MGTPVSNVLKFVMSTRTTLVIFFIYDVDLGIFIFIILLPYKTLLVGHVCLLVKIFKIKLVIYLYLLIQVQTNKSFNLLNYIYIHCFLYIHIH